MEQSGRSRGLTSATKRLRPRAGAAPLDAFNEARAKSGPLYDAALFEAPETGRSGPVEPANGEITAGLCKFPSSPADHRTHRCRRHRRFDIGEIEGSSPSDGALTMEVKLAGC